MAKKYKRSTSAGVTSQTQADSVSVNDKPVAGAARRSLSSEFNPDYTYVIKDLKRIGTLAGSFFVILIVLSFFLNK